MLQTLLADIVAQCSINRRSLESVPPSFLDVLHAGDLLGLTQPSVECAVLYVAGVSVTFDGLGTPRAPTS